MNIKEGMTVRVTPAPKKRRNEPGYWNWSWLLAGIKKCLETGKEQQIENGYELAIIRPRSPLVAGPRSDEYLKTHEKVQVLLFNLANTLYVEKGETIPCPHEAKNV